MTTATQWMTLRIGRYATISVKDFADASRVFCEFRDKNGLSSRSMPHGILPGHWISYNGKIWKDRQESGDTSMCVYEPPYDLDATVRIPQPPTAPPSEGAWWWQRDPHTGLAAIYDCNRRRVAQDLLEYDADNIVRVVNAHDTLDAALKAVVDYWHARPDFPDELREVVVAARAKAKEQQS